MTKVGKSLIKLVNEGYSKLSEAELSEAQQNILRLSRLIVDIEYKRKLGKTLDKDSSTNYSEVTNV